MASNYALTAEYDYVSPSMYAYARRANEAPQRTVEWEHKEQLKAVPKVNNKPKHAQAFNLSTKLAIKIVALLILIAVLGAGIVWTGARTSSINYSINQLKSQNAVLENEIKMLNIEIASTNGMQAVEKYATKKLGLVYPTSSQCIYVAEMKNSGESLRDAIKQKAYKKPGKKE